MNVRVQYVYHSFLTRKTVIWSPQTEIELHPLQEEKQTDEDREYDTSQSDGEEFDEDAGHSRKSNSNRHVKNMCFDVMY